MPLELTAIPPPRRAELILRPTSDDGRHVVKDPRSGEFFNLGPQEAFLLEQLDGQHSGGAICAAFEERFREPLPAEELEEFLRLATAQNLLAQPSGQQAPGAISAHTHEDALYRQSILYWRKSVFDPDRLFTWLAPRLRLLWTSGFLIASLATIALAALVLWSHWHEVGRYLPRVISWETAVLAWIALFVVTTLHEFAHGLTCKYHGGEVHEVGFLLMFFMPCLYCNVSDAWLFRERSKRLWITLAGGYCDLCVWALAVFLWRLTPPATLVNYLAWVVMTVNGFRVFLNFNPLIKLDGYYLLSDWMEIPNLRQRSFDRLAGYVRWLLWGAAKPGPVERGRFLLSYGVLSWLFTITYLGLFLWGLTAFLGGRWGVLGFVLVVLLAYKIVPGLFSGFTGGEVGNMFKLRYKRRTIWLAACIGVPALMFVMPMSDRVSGQFKIRSTQRAEVRAAVAGALDVVHKDEGDEVAAGSVIATLKVDDLESRLAQKRAEVREANAKLALLQAGPRKEEVHEQRQRVARLKEICELARKDLQRKRQAFAADMARLEEQIRQTDTEAKFAQGFLDRMKRLLDKEALAKEKYREAEKTALVTLAMVEQVQAQKRAREAEGTLVDEKELARCAKDLADAESALNVLMAPPRPEQIEAEEAHLARLQEEMYYLQSLPKKLQVIAPVSGKILTPRLREKIGHHFKEGELICEIEDPSSLEAEIPVEEQEVARLQEGQTVELKVRALPFRTFQAKVVRIAPSAVKGDKDVHSTVLVTCRLDSGATELRSGMTGYARIYCGGSCLGLTGAKRFFAYLRREFLW